MHKLLLLSSILLFLNGCTQQGLSFSSQVPAPYSLEYIDAHYQQSNQGNSDASQK